MDAFVPYCQHQQSTAFSITYIYCSSFWNQFFQNFAPCAGYRYVYFGFDRILCFCSTAFPRKQMRETQFRQVSWLSIFLLDLPISGLTVVFSADTCDRSQWRGRGGFSPRFPILRNSAPEPFVYSIVIHILYHVVLSFANIFFNKKFDNAKEMWYY